MAPSLPAPPPSAGLTAAQADPAVRRVIAEFERALNTQDVALYKSLRPGLSADEEKRLRDSFKAVKSQVALNVVGVQIDGSSQATVRVSRQDTVNGKAMPSGQRTFHLVQRDGAWTIQSLGQ